MEPTRESSKEKMRVFSIHVSSCGKYSILVTAAKKPLREL